jgi:FdhD protein
MSDLSDLASVSIGRSGPWFGSVRLELRAPPSGAVPRTLIVSSSCGLCGGRLEEGIDGPQVGSELRVEGLQLIDVANRLWQAQPIFQQTGATHAAGIFDSTGQLLATAEDSGRHNALDKALGKLLLAGRAAGGLGVILSGRISYELVLKSARAELELIAGVSAPSALAAEAASLRNITLCGFVRADRATVYTHPYRVAGLPAYSPREAGGP